MNRVAISEIMADLKDVTDFGGVECARECFPLINRALNEVGLMLQVNFIGDHVEARIVRKVDK